MDELRRSRKQQRTRKYGADLSGSVEHPGMSYLAMSKEPLVCMKTEEFPPKLDKY
jgi:hypothetical protein